MQLVFVSTRVLHNFSLNNTKFVEINKMRVGNPSKSEDTLSKIITFYLLHYHVYSCLINWLTHSVYAITMFYTIFIFGTVTTPKLLSDFIRVHSKLFLNFIKISHDIIKVSMT